MADQRQHSTPNAHVCQRSIAGLCRAWPIAETQVLVRDRQRNALNDLPSEGCSICARVQDQFRRSGQVKKRRGATRQSKSTQNNTELSHVELCTKAAYVQVFGLT